jgi:hypothetical protein
MYLYYDLLQLQNASLGNAFLIKRQNWTSAAHDIACLIKQQLEDATKQLAAGQIISNTVIRRLQQNIITIGMRVPGSLAQKQRMRSLIRGLIVRYGMPAFWMTINPSDLQHPIVLSLAGVDYSGNMFESANTAICEAVASSNPEAVARFFDHICKAVINGLLASNSEEFGIFGQVSNHFGVVETNGRGMLHLHALVWLQGNLVFTNLRDRLLTDSQFAARMIHYLESIVIQGIDESILPNSEVNTAATPPSTNKVESDDEFLVRLCHDANSVAYKKQMHSKNHLAGCFKYGRKASGKNTCRFGMPRDLLSTSMVDDVGNIHIARNHPWINPWNPTIASCIRSNQDISWIPTVSKCLALMYYLTNYATKDNVSPWQILAKTALLKQSIDQAKLTEHPTATEVRLRDKGMDNFALRYFNTLSRDREISGVQVASTLLQLPTFYTVNDNAVRVNLWWLRRYIRTIV